MLLVLRAVVRAALFVLFLDCAANVVLALLRAWVASH
jgi:hypothetical protein